MDKDMNKTGLQLRFYKSALHGLLLLISLYSSFVGKTHITTIDITRGIRSALFLFIVLGVCQIPEFITLYMEKRKEIKGEN